MELLLSLDRRQLADTELKLLDVIGRIPESILDRVEELNTSKEAGQVMFSLMTASSSLVHRVARYFDMVWSRPVNAYYESRALLPTDFEIDEADWLTDEERAMLLDAIKLDASVRALAAKAIQRS